MKLVKRRIKFGELFNEFSKTPNSIDEISECNREIFVKDPNENLVLVTGVIKKKKADIYELSISNGTKLNCADKHLTKTKEGFKFAEDIIIGEQFETTNIPEDLLFLEDKKFLKNDYVYDISMEKVHEYYTPNGLIHHNSMLVIQTAANAQKIYKGNILIMYLDSEEATTTARMASLGVRHPTLHPYNDITIEKVFRSLEGVCLYKEMKNIIEQPSIVVWDSIANTLSEKERQEEDINKSIGYKARLLTVLIPKYVAKLSAYNICLIAVNQLRDNIQIGPYQAPKDLNFMRQGKTIPGGNATKFNAFHIIDSKIKGVVDPKKFGFDGIVVEMKCIKNKLFPPNIPVQLAGHFVTGFNNFWTNYMFLIEHKRIETGGGWNNMVAIPSKKFRTSDAKDLFHNDPEFKQAFNEAVQETIKIEILEKNNPFIFENDEDDDKND